MAASRIRTLLPRLRELATRYEGQTADRELLRRFSAAWDEAAFAEIVRRHGPMVLRVCQRVLHNGHDAEDVCQAAFLLLAQKANAIRWHDSVAGWLYQTAYRLSLKARGAACRRARHEARARPAQQVDPLAELTVGELQAILDDELSRLPEKYRAPIVLCCLEGRSRDEAANCLGWQLATVKDRLERGRERLRVRLARRGVLLGTALASGWLLEDAAQAGLSPHATARAASLIATGQATLASLLPPRVAALAKGATTTMLVCSLTILATGIVLGLGAVVGMTKPPSAAPPARAQKPEARPAPADAALLQPKTVRLVGHKGAVTAVAFAPDGKAVATAGADKTVRIWDPATGVQLHKLEQPDIAVGVAFSPDGKTLAVASAGKVGELILWDVVTRKELWRATQKLTGGTTGHLAGTRGAVAFSADGKRVATGSGNGGVALAMLDVPTGMRIFTSWKHRECATAAVAFSPDGKLLADGDRDVVCLNDTTPVKQSRAWQVKGTVTALAFLPGGTKLAVADGGKAVRILDANTGKQEEAFAGKEPVRTLALSADRKQLVTVGGGGTVLLWDVSGKQERRFSTGSTVSTVALSSDGKWLATAGADGVVIWDLTRDEKPLPRDFQLAEKELTALWADLASDEGGKVYRAGRLLRADPARSVPFLRQRLAPTVAPPDRKRLDQLIADLDADEFNKREAATKELEKHGKAAEAALREALATRPALEVKIRLERLLKRLPAPGEALTAEQLRDVRAVRVLEQTGTPEAKKLLEGLSKASPGWWVTQEAKEALQRVIRRETKR